MTRGLYLPDSANDLKDELFEKRLKHNITEEGYDSLLKLLGLAAARKAQELRAILWLHGKSGGGKGMVKNLLMASFHRYCGTASLDLLERRIDDIDAGLADLLEADPFLVLCDELGGPGIRERRLLSWTGNHPLSARRPHQTVPFTKTLRALWVCPTVDPPRLNSKDGFERRSAVIGFDEANAVLHRFLPRFNEKFGVPAEHSSVAYRPMESSVSLDQILCFKHRPKVARDNTVKYNWLTLQLLPGKERPSYAGARLEVHEGLDGQLLVQYQGRTIPTQEAPPRPGAFRASNGPLRYGPGLDRRVNGVGNHPKESLASLGFIEADSATWNGDGRVRKPPASPRKKPTPRQRIRWKAVQQAKLRGLSLRAIARELGIHRNTVRKYAEAKSPPMMRTRVRSRVSQPDGLTVA